MKEKKELFIAKLIMTLAMGIILGYTVLVKGFESGNIFLIIMFFLLCQVAGFIIHKIGKKK